jgi:hypothetical protein
MFGAAKISVKPQIFTSVDRDQIRSNVLAGRMSTLFPLQGSHECYVYMHACLHRWLAVRCMYPGMHLESLGISQRKYYYGDLLAVCNTPQPLI